MTKILELQIDKDEIAEHFSEGQIKGFMKDLDMTYLEAVCYLYFYNNVGISTRDRSKDNGRPMYVKFAKSISGIIKEKEE